jgi:cytochrome c oxidase cbb3-type subunit 3
MNDSTTSPDPAGSRHDQLLDHAYDGIQEYDNPLPRWWVLLFWVTVAVAPLYILYFHFGPGLLSIERYDAAMIAFYDKQAEELLALGEVTESTLVGLMDDASMMNGGKKIFQSKCSPCHGMFAEGAIGPNLTDAHWLHGPQLMDVYRTVREGVTEKGMLAWERQLRPAELLAVSSYVGSLLGSNPPNPKAPQGTLSERQPLADAAPPAATADLDGAPAAAPAS